MYASTLLLAQSVTQLLQLGGVELSSSRRYVDFTGLEAVRWQYGSSASIDVRVDYSLDDGATWAVLADEYETSGTNPRITAWQVLPDAAKVDDVLLRAVGVGAGLLTTVNFVDLQYR